MRVLVLGAYGFIGSQVARCLVAAGHEVCGLGRSRRTGERLLPTIRWRHADLATLTQPEAWYDILDGIDVVVNASGVLQSGGRDQVVTTQFDAIAALVAASEKCGVCKFVQISAPNVSPEASTEFMRSKARAETCIAASSLEWVILRPGLVIGPNAYGGTGLIRLLAALPWVAPLVYAERPIQTVSLAQLAQVVLEAADGRLPSGATFDVVEDRPHTLRHVVTRFRHWLGFAPAKVSLDLPTWFARGIAAGADALGHLRWRSPLRSTALTVLADGVVGDAQPLTDLRGEPLSDLEHTLVAMPATLQERWFARLYLLFPVVIATLSLFWLVSGVVGIVQWQQAAAVASHHNALSSAAALVFVYAGALVDVTLGAAILYRPWARAACVGMVLVTLAYLAGATVLRPDLWGDPLGSLVKTVPAMLLAVVAWVLLEER